ncbi:MAG: OmpH family outer membrane protein [Salinisphaeraceae bacterium]|nr:OmpH family outer membrane protein [Salinisphaeraceae bacterium]
MTMMKRTFAASLLAFCMLHSAQAAAADLKIAVVNIPKILAEAPQAADARKRMDREFSGRRTKLESMQKRIVADAEKFKRDAPTMSNDARARAEDKLRNDQRDFRRMQDEYNEDVARVERQEMGKLRDSIKDVIDRLVKSERYDLVLTEGILHASSKVDITPRVLAALGKK